MKHQLKIRVAKPPENGVVACRRMTVRERILRFLLGRKARLTVIVPGDTVEELAIKEIKEETHEAV